jgi:UDP-hydrolysing UDP-N-acetyl-D-glucosamine 2-epimerase
MIKKILVFIGSRANYSSIKSVMAEIVKNQNLKLKLVLGASALIDKYGNLVDIIKKDGFTIDAKLYTLVEGENPVSMSKTAGLGIIEMSSALTNLKPDIVITIGDRYETISTSIASAYLNIPLAHTMGGEVTGTIDESIRHATTKFANIHFVASRDAEIRVLKLGENKKNVFNVGCPRIDLVRHILFSKTKVNSKKIFKHGVGNKFDLNKDFLIVSQHPVTTEYKDSFEQILNTLNAVKRINIPTLVLWPNSDAGSDGISKGIRNFREKNSNLNFFYIKNLEIEDYVKLMRITKCLVGNSSSGIREGTFIGTPTVNIGSRQNERQCGKNVKHSSYKTENIYKAIKYQIGKGKYKSEKIYGDGYAGKKISKILNNIKIQVQKKITY